MSAQFTKQIDVATIAHPQSGEARVGSVGPRDN
jgi:hypothetical protein